MQVTDTAHVIQLAVAPVFLLAGIGALLSVLSLRVGRIVDRARMLEDRQQGADDRSRTAIHAELAMLSHRARLVNSAISLCVTTALMICSLIVILFVGAIAGLNIGFAIVFLFVAAMITLITCLLIFLREIYLATSNLRIGPH